MKRSVDAPRWTKEQIVSAAERLGKQYEGIVGREYILFNGLHFDDMYEKVIYPKFGVELYEKCELGSDATGQVLLGRYDVATNTAYLDKSISRESNDPRRIFTCWHEVAGHGTLQGEWLRRRLSEIDAINTVEVTECSLSAPAERRLEWQANLFASRLAAPDWLVHFAMRKTFSPKRPFLYTGPCLYWLNVQGLQEHKRVVDFGDLCGWVGSKISGYFGALSGEAIGYRLSELGWIVGRDMPQLHLHRAAKHRPFAEAFVNV